MGESRRVEKWDYLKCILIFLVVLGHVADFYVDKSSMMRMVFIFIYTFHMPLFIFLSGMFSKKKIDERRYDKIFSFLILYFVIKMILCVCNMFLTQTFSFSVFYESGVPWYAMAIFLQCLMTIFLGRFSPKYVLIASIVLACFLGLDSTVTDFMSLSRTIVFYPFFFLGYCMDQEKITKAFHKKSIKIVAAILLIVLALIVILKIDQIYWIRPLLTGRNPYSALKDSMKYGPLLRLLYYMIATVVGAAVIALVPEKINHPIGKWMASIGEKTLQIYALHYPLIKAFVYIIPLYPFMKKVLPHYTMLYAFLLAFFITIFCGMRIFTGVFQRIVFPKKGKNE